MAVTDEILKICVDTLPDLATFVPEKRQELTTEGGLDVARNAERIAEAIAMLHENDIEVSLFIDPIDAQIEAAAEAGADIVELHTGDYGNARSEEQLVAEMLRIRNAAVYAKSLDLGVNAGHGLNYVNIRTLAAVREIDEVSIGHAILARAVFVGLPKAVEDMARLVNSGGK